LAKESSPRLKGLHDDELQSFGFFASCAYPAHQLHRPVPDKTGETQFCSADSRASKSENRWHQFSCASGSCNPANVKNSARCSGVEPECVIGVK